MRPVNLALLLLAAPALAQYDAEAPTPIARVRGEVVVYGAAFEGHRVDFLEPLNEEDAVVLVAAPGVDLEEERASWTALGRTSTTVQAARADPDAWGPIVGAAAIFLIGEPVALAQAYAATGTGAALRAALERGARIGAAGDTARVLGALRLEADGFGGGLDLVQGSLVDPAHPGGPAPGPRLAAALGELPMFVGVAVEPAGRLLLEQRWLTGVGAAAFVAPGAGWELRVVEFGAGRRGDLTSLSRSAQARALRPWPPPNPAPPHLASGTLMLGGGPMPRGTLERFLTLAGGFDAPVVYIPCSYSETIDEEPGFVRTLRRAGARDVRWLHTKDRRAADGDVELLAQLEEARGVWFGGGRQWNLVDSYQHTQVHRLVEAVLARGGVVGGSSAGASIQADYMARGNPLGNLDIMAEGYEEGLGLLTGIAVDQHFTQRGRLPDLESLVARHPQYLGIGLDEGAVLLVQGQVGEVFGSAVHFLHRSDGEQVHRRLTGGQRFDLVEREPLGE